MFRTWQSSVRTRIAQASEEWKVRAIVDHGEALFQKNDVKDILPCTLEHVRQDSTRLDEVFREAVQEVYGLMMTLILAG